MSEKGLYEKLKEHGEAGYLAMHMPGHKRNGSFLRGLPTDIDITEIEGFDDLHDMGGVLLQTAQLGARMYGAKKSYPLVNGSSAGILAAVTAATQGRGRLLMARNCHKSAYNAASVNRLTTSYLYPEQDEAGILGAITPDAVEAALEKYGDVSAVLVTSPTFEGVTSDIAAIAGSCHRHGVPLIVDAAHGAHFGFDAAFPEQPVRLGADYVIMSLHKTLPALTQCALLAIGGDADEELTAYALSIFETTSPSYILLAAIDECLRELDENAAALFGALADELKNFYKNTPLRRLRLRHYDDPSRIIIDCSGADINGSELAQWLRSEHKIEIEMAYADYAVLIASICDTHESFARLTRALTETDKRLMPRRRTPAPPPPIAKTALPLHAACLQETDKIPVAEAVGRICGEYIFAYPPGIPIAAPGELITQEAADFITAAPQRGIKLHGSRCKEEGWTAVLR